MRIRIVGIRSARKTVRWTVFSGERAAAPGRRGSNPLSSTTHPRRLKSFRGLFVRKMIFGKYDIISSSSVYMDVGGERHVSNVKSPDSAPHRDQEFERLVEQYPTAVLRTCYLYLCDKSLAEDASQETFVKVYRTLDSFKGESSEKTWIMKIAMHTCYDINHSSWHRFFNRHITPEMLPVAIVPFDDVDDELTNAVIRQPLKLREVILLHYFQGMKVNDIAEALGIAASQSAGLPLETFQHPRHRSPLCSPAQRVRTPEIIASTALFAGSIYQTNGFHLRF